MRSADVVVVGAGIVGACVAHEFARRGRRVVVVEKEAVGAGASGRNAGSLVYPLDPRLTDLYRQSLACIGEVAGAGRGLDLDQGGMLLLAHDPEDARTVTAALASQFPELAPEYLGPGEAHRVEPALAEHLAACRSAVGHQIDPLQLTTAFLDAARQAGATLLLEEAALDVVDGQVRGVSTPQGTIAADVVVVCAGPSVADLLDAVGARLPIAPVWGVIAEVRLPQPPRHILLTASDLHGALGLSGHGVDVVDEQDRDRREIDATGFGMVTIGGRSAVGHSLTTTPPDPGPMARTLLQGASAYVPAVTAVPILSTRVAARPTSRDDLPVLGKVPGQAGCYVAGGHGGRGVTLGPGSARLLVESICDGRPIPPELDVRRFVPTRHTEP